MKMNRRAHSPRAGKLASCCCFAALLASAQAGPDKVFSPYFAWDNNFNNSNIGISFGTGTDPQWTASFNFSSYSGYGFPASIRGWHYGWNPANDNLFPKQVSSIHSCPCAFSYASGGSNMAGDFAYDTFLRNDNAKSTPQLEVMVWGGNNSYPLGTLTARGVITTGGYTFDLWEGMNNAAGYYDFTFLPNTYASTIPTSGNLNIDLKTFYNWLAANRSSLFKNSMYLDVVEAGFEITRGNGWVSTTWFTCSAS